MAFLLRRLGHALVVLVGVTIVVFAIVHLVPGDPVRIAMGTRFDPDVYAALRAASGLDQPLLQQYVGYIGSAVTGDLGVSFRSGEPVTEILLSRLPATVSLALVGIVIALLMAFPLGIYSALHSGRKASQPSASSARRRNPWSRLRRWRWLSRVLWARSPVSGWPG